MIKDMNLKFTSLIILVLLTSCSNILPNIKNDINDIKFKIPNSWKNINLNNNKANNIKIPENWWILFKDEKLNKIVEKALSDNKDIKIALLNIQKSLLNNDRFLSDNMMPNFDAGISHIKKNIKTIQNSKNYTNSNYSSRLNVNYQIDLFGKLINKNQSLNLITKATAEDAYNAGLIIISKTINKYWTLALLNEKIDLYKETIKTAEKIYKISKIKFKSGSISKMNLLNVENFLNNQKYSLEVIKSQREEAYTDLTSFLSMNPYTKLDIPNKLSHIKLPDLPVKYPLLVLANRPDVRSSQLKLLASLKNTKVAIKNFFPDISFNAGLMNSSNTLKNLMSNPVTNLTFNFSLPILQWPTNYTNFKLTKVNYNENLIQFKDIVFNALKEVEIAFYNFKISENNYNLSKKLYENNKKIEKAMQVRYEVGTDSFDNYLNAKHDTIESKIKELESRCLLYKNYLLKILSLGGSDRPQSNILN